MEVLLLEDVNGIGKKNDLLVVGDGFALNHLLPQRKALVATPTVRKRYAEQIRKRAEEKEHEREVQTQLSSALAGKSVTFQRKVTKAGKLYAGVTEQNIADALNEQHKIPVSADSIELAEHIKVVGTYQVPVKVGTGMQNVSVVVAEEK